MRGTRLGALAMLAGLAACGGDGHTPTEPTGPVAGLLKVALATPNADDGALLFTISGGPVSAVDAAAPGYQLYTARPDSNTTRVLVTGDIAAGEVVRLHVADTRRASSYHATVAQAASRATFAMRVVSGYALTVAP